jgi:hypothetical protein
MADEDDELLAGGQLICVSIATHQKKSVLLALLSTICNADL